MKKPEKSDFLRLIDTLGTKDEDYGMCLTALYKHANQIHLSYSLGGKMDNMLGISTSCLNNERCVQRQAKDGLICNKCYAEASMSRYRQTNESFMRNGKILSKHMDDLQVLAVALEVVSAFAINPECKAFRYETHGDLMNATHAMNYFNIASKVHDLNPKIHQTLWTKNFGYLIEGYKMAGVDTSDFFNIVLSSYKMNEPLKNETLESVSRQMNGYPLSRFTVYDSLHSKYINCRLHCSTCLSCYMGKVDIREKLKENAQKAKNKAMIEKAVIQFYENSNESYGGEDCVYDLQDVPMFVGDRIDLTYSSVAKFDENDEVIENEIEFQAYYDYKKNALIVELKDDSLEEKEYTLEKYKTYNDAIYDISNMNDSWIFDEVESIVNRS